VTLYGGNDGLNTVVPSPIRSTKVLDRISHSPRRSLLPFTDRWPSTRPCPRLMRSTDRAKSRSSRGELSRPQPLAFFFHGYLAVRVAHGFVIRMIGRWLDKQPITPLTRSASGRSCRPHSLARRASRQWWTSVAFSCRGVPRRRCCPIWRSSSSDVALEAAAATSITDLFSTASLLGRWCRRHRRARRSVNNSRCSRR